MKWYIQILKKKYIRILFSHLPGEKVDFELPSNYSLYMKLLDGL